MAGSKDSSSNDLFCRRLDKVRDAIVIAVGYHPVCQRIGF